uniref:Nucleoplasmin-like n=1 Tax=Geotrypetes seraphini TaxID=260995 RepID=A0A6P8RKM8_GEOSA|nr:nucleoplasmin-like [Geotrypetes seraphini]
MDRKRSGLQVPETIGQGSELGQMEFSCFSCSDAVTWLRIRINPLRAVCACFSEVYGIKLFLVIMESSSCSTNSDQDHYFIALWGCELNKSTKMSTFEPEDDVREHLLSLQAICLGAEAGDELNVIAVQSSNASPGKAVPIASLQISILPTINMNGLELIPPVTFTLKAGSGPVYISGQHVALEEDLEEEGNDSYQN